MINSTPEVRKELSDIFTLLSQNLDITKTQYDNLVKSYSAVGKYLEADPVFAPYHPVITPQGSLRLGTIIQPINEDDDLDVDLVYRLIEKKANWTQSDIKSRVGNRLKEHGTYKDMLDEEGRRCWTLLYRQDSDNVKEHYHMDILPCVADTGYTERLQRMVALSFSAAEVDKIAIRITDNKASGYYTSTDKGNWMKSNPDGYAMWFASRCKNAMEMRATIMNTIMPIGTYVAEKSILQRIVQILKRHRDIMFNGDEDKPISIIITTLASRAYRGETNLFEGLSNVIDSMEQYIKKATDGTYLVENPVNPEENFADKWITHPKRKENFFKWLQKLKEDKNAIVNLRGVQLRDRFAGAFGKNVTTRIFGEMTKSHKDNASNGKLRISATGAIGAIGKTLNAHNTYFGKE